MKKISVSFYGASVTQQAINQSGEMVGYVPHTKKIVEEKHPEYEFVFHQLGFGSNHLDDAGYLYFSRLLDTSPDIVFLEWHTTGLAKFDSAKYDYIIEKLLNMNCVAVNLILPFKRCISKPERENIKQSRWYQEKGVRQINFYKLLDGQEIEKCLRDEVHTNQYGGLVYGKIISKVIEDILQGKQIEKDSGDVIAPIEIPLKAPKVSSFNLQRDLEQDETMLVIYNPTANQVRFFCESTVGPFSPILDVRYQNKTETIMLIDQWCSYERKCLKPISPAIGDDVSSISFSISRNNPLEREDLQHLADKNPTDLRKIKNIEKIYCQGGEILNIEITKRKIKVFVFANCHGAIYKQALQEADKEKILDIEHVISYENMNNFEYIKPKFAECDILIIQPVQNYEQFKIENIKPLLKKECQLIRVPFIRFNGLWDKEDVRELKNFSEPAVMFFPKIFELKEIDTYLKGTNNRANEIVANFEKGVEELRVLEKQGDVQFADFITSNCKNFPLFRDPYHPTTVMYDFIAYQILKKVSATISDLQFNDFAMSEKIYREPGHFKPIRDDVANVLGIKYDLDSYFVFSRKDYLNAVLSYENSNATEKITTYIEFDKLVREYQQKIKGLSVKEFEIDIILIPTIRKEFDSLYTYIKNMLSPRKKKTKLILSLDKTWEDSEKKTILNLVKKNPDIASLLDVYFISCKLSDEESVYIRKFDKGSFDINKLPYGIKSGPNMQFFRSIQHLIKYNSGVSCILCEVDTIPLHDYWLEKIENECKSLGKFYIAGTEYSGVSKIPIEISKHVNGNAVINFTAENFKNYLFDWEKLLLDAMHYVPWHAYDVITEWLSYNQERFQEKSRVDYFLDRYKLYVKRINSLVNFAGPEENGQDYIFSISKNIKLLEDASVLHLKAALPYVHSLRANLMSLKHIKQSNSFIIYDDAWQYPAITEKVAADKVCEFLENNTTKNSVYIGFPWATLIDLKKNDSPRADALEKLLELITFSIQGAKKVVTTCQHIFFKEFLYFFESVAVSDVFWSHKVKNEESLGNINIHAFPLYPAQISDNIQIVKSEKSYLFSFVGAKANSIYLSKSRNMIGEHLANIEKSFIQIKDTWFYQKVVYEEQVQRKGAKNSSDKEYQKLLENSIFSLCPSGSGPNSIRLWESIGFGAIPVILADTYMPPGNQALWEEAAVFCEETEEAIKALPDRLEKIAQDPELLERKRHAMKQLWMLYGPDCFVYDIQKLFLQFDAENLSVTKRDDTFEKIIHLLLQEKTPSLELVKLCINGFILRTLSDSTTFQDVYINNAQSYKALKLVMEKSPQEQVSRFEKILQYRNISL